MNKKNVSTILFIIAIICIIVGAIMLNKGHDKMTNYYSSSYFGSSQNAYVGGDAYNYIINGTYSTTFCIVGMGCLIMALISFIGGCYFITSTQDTNDVHSNVEELPSLD